MHGFALLPQLMLSHRRGFVSPAAVRFLLLTATKLFVELYVDLKYIRRDYLDDQIDFDDFTFIGGDVFAAAVLLDFLYLYATSHSKVHVLTGDAGMVLPV